MPFDTQDHIATSIRRPEGPQTIEVRWPTDQEWIERSKGWHIVIQRMGRGVSETQVDSQKADSKLYERIRQNGSPDLDPDEAGKIVEALTRCDITNVTLQLDQATVEMTVTGGQKVRHTLRIPTTAEVTQFRRAAVRVMDMPHGKQQLRTNLQAGMDLWEKCHAGSEGYANGVPITHCDAAVRAVIEACEMEAEAAKEEDF